MARFTWGEVEEPGLGGYSRSAGLTVVEADRYVIGEGFVSFILGEEFVVSVPSSRVGLVSRLDDDNNMAYTVEDSPERR